MEATAGRQVERVASLADEAATVALARRIAALAGPGDVIALAGELGVGKTRFARAFVDTLTGEREEVPSPTFTLVQTYDSPAGPIWHFDLYRLSRPDEAYELGIEEALTDGISLIEWPDRAQALLPEERLDLTLAFAAAPNARTARIAGRGSWADRLAGLFPNG
jgi:tRNA threonylcarbamoyladenosine biosynthesis protein TsaE